MPSIIQPTVVPVVSANGNATGNFLVKWANLQNGDVGAPWAAAEWADRNVQVVGTFGAGGSLAFQGSNVPNALDADYAVLHDSQGVAIAITLAGFAEISEVPWYTRPKVTAGDGTTLLTVLMMVRRTFSK